MIIVTCSTLLALHMFKASVIIAITLFQEVFAPMAKDHPSMVEVLKKQLTLSESTVQDLRKQVHTLQATVEQLTQENSELKHLLQVII